MAKCRALKLSQFKMCSSYSTAYVASRYAVIKINTDMF
jgi:hypothetical protein